MSDFEVALFWHMINLFAVEKKEEILHQFFAIVDLFSIWNCLIGIYKLELHTVEQNKFINISLLLNNFSWPKLPYHAERTEISGEGSLCFALFYFATVLMGGWSLLESLYKID